MTDGVDFITLLPGKVSLYILSFLDAESLLACAAVNNTWNEMTNSLQQEIWFKACLKAGISVSQDKCQDAREWKAFLSPMLQRLRDMKASVCYEIVSFPFNKSVTAIYCHNGKIAVAYAGAVEILGLCNIDYRIEFQCQFKPSLLKFDDNMLVAASSAGYIASWSATSGNRLRDYFLHSSTLFSFDFLTDYSLIVSSVLNDDSTSNIYMWSTKKDGRIHKIDVEKKFIYRVILAPIVDPCFIEQKESCFLFALSEDCVLVWTVESVSGLMCAQNSVPCTISHIPDIHMNVSDLSPYGFLFDGHELYFTVPSPQRSSTTICAWNFKDDTVRRLEYSGEILNLLSVGEKYLVYNVRCTDYDAIYAVDKKSNEYITIVGTARITSDVSICLGHTSWLDGLNGENDSGVVCISIINETSLAVLVKFCSKK